MKKYIVLLLSVFALMTAKAQTYYYPPTTGTQWDTISPNSLGWCVDKLDTVYNFLEAKHTKGFIILKGGKIAAEKYFNGFSQDSLWYWASVGKSLTSFLVGVAQQDGKININDSASHYLGSRWTSCTPEQEGEITLKNLLSMTSGLDDSPPVPQEPNPSDCTRPECLQYNADAGTRWAYHNAAYYMLHAVLDSATGFNTNQYTFQKLRNSTGINGIWYEHLFISRVRDLARFGSLVINKGKWETTSILSDSNYFNAMTNSSQSINPSYGYLWWLNGKSSYKTPGFQLSFNGALIPTAPMDMFAGLGKNDQKLYIIPSMDMVIVRMGESAGAPLFALSSFDSDLWSLLSDVFCAQNPNVSVQENTDNTTMLSLYPNPVATTLTIGVKEPSFMQVIDISGRVVAQKQIEVSTQLNVEQFVQGVYFVTVRNKQGEFKAKFMKQ